MESKTRPKMPLSQRAKQFLPFSALPELTEALARQEHVPAPRPELTEDAAGELNRNMENLRRGSMAQVVYVRAGETIKITGMVSRVDKTSRFLQIVDTKISFDEILWACSAS